MKKKWTEDEEQYLLKNFAKLGPTKCGEYLSRSKGSVGGKATQLGLTTIKKYSKVSKRECCPLCEQTFSHNGLSRHIKRMHSTFNCRVCNTLMTKHTHGLTEFCSDECRAANKAEWSSEWHQQDRVKEMFRGWAKAHREEKKAEDPEWGLKPLVEKPCPECGTLFECRGNKKKYCSDDCQTTFNKKRSIQVYHETKYVKGLVNQTINKTCKLCECSFETTRKEKVYCSKKCRAKYQNSQPKNKARKLRWQNEQRKDPNSWFNQTMQKITHRMRGRLRGSLMHRGIKKTNQTFSLLGYTKYELKEHLESQFTDGMSWDNMSDWHIDHIRPVASFNYDSTDHPDFKKCWSLNNLQPMWAKDNMSKGAKWDGVVNA